MSDSKIKSVKTLHGEFKEFLLSWLETYVPGVSDIVFDGIVLLWIALFAIALHFFLHGFLRPLLERFFGNREQ
ncbi:MAG: hypothetical protein ACO3MW_08980, partial [Rhodospirillales bacterium]